VQAFGSYVVFGPAKARHDDHSLAIYEAAGFTGARAGQAMAAVFTFVLGNALGPAAVASLTRKLSRDGGNATELLRDHMANAREIAMQFPRLRASLDTAAADYGAASENTFEFGLQAILDGLEAKLIVRRTPADQNARKPPRHDQEPRAASPPGHSSGQDPESWARRSRTPAPPGDRAAGGAGPAARPLGMRWPVRCGFAVG